MTYIDLTHQINPNMPVYPGTRAPKIIQSANLSNDKYRETDLYIKSHTGTHIDAPAHMLKNGQFLGDFDISNFCGKALIIKVPEGTNIISKSFLKEYSDVIELSEFVLFNTGWGRYWGSPKYFENFPLLSKEALTYMISNKIKGIGFDTISADEVNSTDYFNHYLLFENGLIIIENLIFPKNFNKKSGELFCFPLKFDQADGSPVRAVLKIDDKSI